MSVLLIEVVGLRDLACHILCLFLFASGSGSKSATGLLEWLDIDSSLDAFVMTNHQTAFSQSKLASLIVRCTHTPMNYV